jgi:lysophospholipase L1-like esterase
MQIQKLVALAIGLSATSAATDIAAPAQNPPGKFSAPKSYYLALGDSIAYGYQAVKAQANLPPSAYNTGYVDAFATRLRQIRPNITAVNYSCPGESTESFVNGPCPWTAAGHQLHNPFSGTQLQAAIEFLHVYRGHVSPITLTLFGNDLPILLNPCTAGGQINLTCVQANAPAFIAGFAERISGILAQLRSAAPDAEIIVTGAWDPYITMLALVDPLYQAVNKATAEAAAANRARFADPFPIFNPQGGLPAEVQSLCRLTLLCTQNDSHPSDAGYQALADAVFEVFDSAGEEDGRSDHNF